MTNELYEDISELFSNAGIENFEKLPSDIGSADSPQADEIIRTYRSRGYRLNIVHCSRKLFNECLADLFNIEADTETEKGPEK